MQEAKVGFVDIGQGGPVRPHGFKQEEGANDVGLDKVLRAVDGAVHVTIGGEVQNRKGEVLSQQGV